MPTKIAALLAAAALVALAAVGCANPGTLASNYEVRISPDFTADQQSAIVEACRDWMGAVPELGLQPVIESCGGGENGVICLRPGTQAEIDALAGTPGAWGITLDHSGVGARSPVSGGIFGHDGGDTTLLETVTNMQKFEAIAAHEIGHAMGLAHTDSGTIMCWALSCGRVSKQPDAWAVTPTDAAQWRSFR